ncbi:MAG: DUF6851 domain-containing protein, partial [Pseudomonadota bacterium]
MPNPWFLRTGFPDLLRNLALFTAANAEVRGTRGDNVLSVDEATFSVNSWRGNDTVTLDAPIFKSMLGRGNDTLTANDSVFRIAAGRGDDDVTVNASTFKIDLGDGADVLSVNAEAFTINAGHGDDTITFDADVQRINLGDGDDVLTANAGIELLFAGHGDDTVTLNEEAGQVNLGRGDDTLNLSQLIVRANGAQGTDHLSFDFAFGEVDLLVKQNKVWLYDRFTGEKMDARNFETFSFTDQSFTFEELAQRFSSDAQAPFITVADGTQALTVNNTDPTVSVLWDRVVQQAVIETESFVGPTIASRAYAMVHTAMYDAWSSYDDTALRVSFDLEGDNIAGNGGDAEKAKAMSLAAITVLRDLFPDMEDLYASVMQDRLGYALEDDGSQAARIGIDAAEDLLALRGEDGSNQANGYADTTGYTPFNPNPTQINDITRWTPENVPIDPEDASPAEQNFLTAQWLEVESFGLAENPDGTTDFSGTLPEAPQPFFTDPFSDATLNFADKTITLGSDATIGG